MSVRIQIRIEGEGGATWLVVETHDRDFIGKQVELRLLQIAQVKRSNPVHKRNVLLSRRFTLAAAPSRFALEGALDPLFAYRGEDLDLQLKVELEVDDGILFDTDIERELRFPERLPPREAVPAQHRDVHSPKDRFDFFANLRAIPAKARLIVLWLVLLGGPVIVANAVVGARDQFVPESRAWFYDHSDSDGESESPLFKALAGSGTIGLALWMAIRHQLKKYMRFAAQLPPGLVLRRGARCRPEDIVSGQARVPLQGAMLRVVAYNREHGQYTQQEKDGNSTRTVTKDFRTDARGLVLYQQILAYLPADAPLASALSGEVVFDPIFDALYPPTRIGSSHGLSLCLEAQLLHPDYIDHDVELADPALEAADFYRRQA
jgi:hypothetical protein